MSEENQAPAPEGQQQQMQLLIDDREMRVIYVNATMFQQSAGDEVIIDVGHNLLRGNPQGGNPQMVLKLSDRLIMSYPSAKRLMNSLVQLIKRHEQQFGEINIGQRR